MEDLSEARGSTLYESPAEARPPPADAPQQRATSRQSQLDNGA